LSPQHRTPQAEVRMQVCAAPSDTAATVVDTLILCGVLKFVVFPLPSCSGATSQHADTHAVKFQYPQSKHKPHKQKEIRKGKHAAKRNHDRLLGDLPIV
jgi:hypothetical protein